MKYICDNCGKEFERKPSRIGNKKYCSIECYNKNKNGNKNPNFKYNYDRDIFKNIDTEFKAWLLGWIITDGSLKEDSVILEIHKKDIDVLKQIVSGIHKNIPIKHTKNNVRINLYSKEIVQDLLKIFNLDKPEKKSDKLSSVNIPKEFIYHFIRGVFEGDGHVRCKSSPEATITSSSLEFLEFLQENIPVQSVITKNNIYNLNFYGVNALDFLYLIYGKSIYKMSRKYDKYIDICTWTPILKGKNNSTKINGFYVAKTDKKAIFPSKKRASDSGYDLTLINIHKKIGKVIFYETGIRVTPPLGYYFDLVPRSSIVKSGYMLANSIGVIDRTYNGSIKVPLIKIDENAPDLELPSKLVQIILRPIIHVDTQIVENLEATNRGEGGFGSTDMNV